jgi:four helix bundle protein
MHKYTDLEVYKLALRLTVNVRQMTRGLPREERVILGDQWTRAADSIVLNIAEGAGCNSNAEFSRSLGYALRSGFECKACCDIAEENGLCGGSELQTLRENADRIVAMLYGLQKHHRAHRASPT